jgi:hypothetical protein
VYSTIRWRLLLLLLLLLLPPLAEEEDGEEVGKGKKGAPLSFAAAVASAEAFPLSGKDSCRCWSIVLSLWNTAASASVIYCSYCGETKPGSLETMQLQESCFSVQM